MNKFIILRKISTNKKISIYPKCINCINFQENSHTCKKSIITENFINYDVKNEFAINVRNNEKQCGESGNWFQIGEMQLQEHSRLLLTTFFSLSALSAVTCIVTDASKLTLFPLAINLFSLFTYLEH
jgi:hypothetical protein